MSNESVLSIFNIGAPGLSVSDITFVSEDGRTGLFTHSVAEGRRLRGEVIPAPCLEKTVADWMELADWRIRFPPPPPPPVEEEGEPLPPPPPPFGRQAGADGGTPPTPTPLSPPIPCVLLETC